MKLAPAFGGRMAWDGVRGGDGNEGSEKET